MSCSFIFIITEPNVLFSYRSKFVTKFLPFFFPRGISKRDFSRRFRIKIQKGLKGLKARRVYESGRSLPITGAVYRRAIKILSKKRERERRGRASNASREERHRRTKRNLKGHPAMYLSMQSLTRRLFVRRIDVVVDDQVCASLLLLRAESSKKPRVSPHSSRPCPPRTPPLSPGSGARCFTLDTDRPAGRSSAESWNKITISDGGEGGVCIERIIKRGINNSRHT